MKWLCRGEVTKAPLKSQIFPQSLKYKPHFLPQHRVRRVDDRRQAHSLIQPLHRDLYLCESSFSARMLIPASSAFRNDGEAWGDLKPAKEEQVRVTPGSLVLDGLVSRDIGFQRAYGRIYYGWHIWDENDFRGVTWCPPSLPISWSISEIKVFMISWKPRCFSSCS